MAYKDEYEVARLYTDGKFIEKLKQQFDGELSLKFNLAPPLLSKKDAQGHLVKAEYGRWMFKAFGLLARFKGLRGTRLDPFGQTAERKMERQLIVEYRALVQSLLQGLTADTLPQAIALASLAEKVRGFGHVKEAAVENYRREVAAGLQAYAAGKADLPHAA
jgi:indolepyruvate ferredoxin oxidoreductase